MSTRLHSILLVFLFAVAIFFATYNLKESPPVWYDEGFFVQSAANLATHGQMGLRLAPSTIEPPSKLITVGYPLIYPLALGFKVFGVNITTARSLMVLFLLMFMLASYVLARRLFGKNVALGTLALLVTLPTLYGNGKSVLGEVPGLTYLVLFLICFVQARSSITKKYAWLITASIFAGLCVATKPTFLLLLPAVAVGAFIEWRRSTFNLKELSTVAITGLIPIVYWIVTQFRTGDSFYTIFTEYSNPYQIQNMLHTILVNIGHLFTDIGPLYLTVMMSVWIFALWIRHQSRERVPAEEFIVMVFSVLTIVSYLRTAGWYRYLFEAQALALVFFPGALFVTTGFISEKLMGSIKKFTQYIPDTKNLSVAVIVVLTVLGAYQVRFNSFVAESYGGNKTAFLEDYFANVPATTSYFFYDVPEVAFFDTSTNYYQYISPSGWPIGEEQLAVIEKGVPDNIILKPQAYADMKDTLFISYEVEQTTRDYLILIRRDTK